MTGVSSVGMNNTWNSVKRVARIYPDVVFGTGGDAITSTLRDSFYGIKGVDGKRTGGKYFKDFWTQLKEAFKAGEVHNDKLIKESGGFWKAQWESIKSTPKVVKEGWIEGGKVAEAAGKNKIWGKTKGLFKGLAKRLPIIGSLMIAVTELPNIIRATKDEGIVSGGAEVVKAGARLGGSMLFATLGAALGGPVGMIAGGIIGDWLVGKVVGKTYSQRLAEKEGKDSKSDLKTTFNPPGASMTPEQLMALQQALAGGAGLNFNTYA